MTTLLRRAAMIGALMLAGCYGSVFVGIGDDDFDDARPSVSLVASPDVLIQAGSTTLSAAASDDRGVTTVQFFRLDGGSIAVMIGSVDAPPYQMGVAFTRADNGSSYFFARAFDTAGQSADSSVVGVTVAIP